MEPSTLNSSDVQNLEGLLVCSACHAQLNKTGSGSSEVLICTACTREYPKVNNVFSMIPDPPIDALADKWDLWTQLQANAMVPYEEAPELNLFAEGGNYAEAFSQFLGESGLTLDVGCGPQFVKPAYASTVKTDNYIGLDPLVGKQPRGFRFVNALGEAIPFNPETFETVLFSSSIDHLMDFRLGLDEAKRVLKHGGSIQLMLDLFEGDSEEGSWLIRKLDSLRRIVRQVVLGTWYMGPRRLVRYLKQVMTLKVPEGATDYFHMYFPKLEEIKKELSERGFTIEREERFKDMVLLDARKNQ